jgi:hypothetical protein
MKVYDEIIDVREKRDGSYTVSVRLNDEVIVVRTVTRAQLEQLKHKLMDLLKV